MQARPTPRIRCSLVLLLLGLLITFLLFLFYFLFISPNSQPSSLREKGPFASLACLPALTAIHPHRLQAHPLRWMGHFLLLAVY
jgi:hypothetical protein